MTEGAGLGAGLAASRLIYISSREKSGVSHFPVSTQLDPKPLRLLCLSQAWQRDLRGQKAL